MDHLKPVSFSSMPNKASLSRFFGSGLNIHWGTLPSSLVLARAKGSGSSTVITSCSSFTSTLYMEHTTLEAGLPQVVSRIWQVIGGLVLIVDGSLTIFFCQKSVPLLRGLAPFK